jgi:WD40 repeat protein
MVRMTFGPNHGIGFSPDGALLAVCSAHHVEVIDARTGAVLRLIRGHAGMVADAAFSPDGTVIVTGSYDGTARTWEVATGKPLVTFAGHDGAVYAVAFSPDGTRIATASSDETARVWDAASGAAVVTMAGHFEAVQDVAFSPDGTRLATTSTLRALVWDAVTGQGIASFGGHADTVTSVAFSPDGTLVVSGALDETARVWEAATGRERVVLAEHGGTDADAAFVPDGTMIVTGSSDREVRVWDAATGASRARFECNDRVNALAVSPDGTVVAATTTITARTWEIATAIPGVTISGGHDYLNAVAFDPSGALLGIASTDKTATVWDVTTGVPVATLAGHGSSVTAVAFSPASPSGQVEAATGSLDGIARTWDAVTGRPGCRACRALIVDQRGRLRALGDDDRDRVRRPHRPHLGRRDGCETGDAARARRPGQGGLVRAGRVAA